MLYYTQLTIILQHTTLAGTTVRNWRIFGAKFLLPTCHCSLGLSRRC